VEFVEGGQTQQSQRMQNEIHVYSLHRLSNNCAFLLPNPDILRVDKEMCGLWFSRALGSIATALIPPLEGRERSYVSDCVLGARNIAISHLEDESH
jgi:hypothetical protein